MYFAVIYSHCASACVIIDTNIKGKWDKKHIYDEHHTLLQRNAAAMENWPLEMMKVTCLSCRKHYTPAGH